LDVLITSLVLSFLIPFLRLVLFFEPSLAGRKEESQGQLLRFQANLDVLRITQAKPLPVKAVVKVVVK
ncbi:hypothetical protein TIFTF001_049853, partial [Ficus carica]